MKTIKTEEALFNWLFARLLKAEPIIDVTPGLLLSAECLRFEIEDVGFLARYDQECWYATFECLLKRVSPPGRARCSEKVIEWMAEIYAATTVDPEVRLSLQRIILIMIHVLDLEGESLALKEVGSAVQIRSTVLCQRKFGVKICVDSE